MKKSGYNIINSVYIRLTIITNSGLNKIFINIDPYPAGAESD